KREPDNPHTPFAIEIFTVDGVKLGYVPRASNWHIADLIERGQLVEAVIADPQPEHHYEIRVALYHRRSGG
ncbi:MAG: HIRAN domain-containing protein, partial [Alphaproteobacteria bacterium]